MPVCFSCGSHDTLSQHSSVYCGVCGAVLEESQIVSDVTFGENSAGGAVVQGSYVSAAQSHVRSSNPRFRSGGAGESREQTMGRAREAIQRMGRANRVSPATCEKALRWFNLALDGVPEAPLPNGMPQPKNYILGRKQEYTVAACLYVACRYAKTSHLLIDFAEAIDINVFSLGRHYLKLIAALNIKLPVIDPSFYILRFASLLDFGEETNKVAQDATRLCVRFKKDWLGDGRRPAGICGAALLLAARMNNFQRSMNEVVQVVKMADVTIRERLEEFKRTPSGSLSIQDFKDIWLEEEHEPPAFYRPMLEEQKKRLKAERLTSSTTRMHMGKRKRVDSLVSEPYADGARHSHSAVAGDQSAISEECNVETSLRSRGDDLTEELDAFVDEATRQEIDQYTQDETFIRMAQEAEMLNLASQRRARMGTRAIMMATERPPVASVESPQSMPDETGHEGQHDAAVPAIGQSALRQQSLDSQSDGASLSGGAHVHRTGPDHDDDASLQGNTAEDHSGPAGAASQACSPGPTLTAETAAGPSRLSISEPEPSTSLASVSIPAVRPSAPVYRQLGSIDTLSDLDEDELDQFILGEEEVRIKERIWMEFNHDYLQDALQRRLKDEADLKAGVYKKRGPRKKGGIRGLARDSGNATATTAEEATRDMLLRKKTSKKLNYGVIENLFSRQTGASGYAGTAHQSRDRGAERREDNDGSSDDGGVSDAIGLFKEDGAPIHESDVLEEPGDALPTTHPLHRKESRAERANKEKRRQQSSGFTGVQSGEESGGHDVGEPLSDGATTGGEEADDLSWQQYRQDRACYRYQADGEDDEDELG